MRKNLNNSIHVFNLFLSRFAQHLHRNKKKIKNQKKKRSKKPKKSKKTQPKDQIKKLKEDF